MQFQEWGAIAEVAHSLGASSQKLEHAARDLLNKRLVRILSPVTPTGDYVGYYAEVYAVDLKNGSCYVHLCRLRRKLDGKPLTERYRKDKRRPYPVSCVSIQIMSE